MKIACLQFAPQVGDVDNNLNRADAVLAKANPDDLEDLDLLVLPELAFTGYNFTSLNHISPFLEPQGSGISALWARTTALKYNTNVVVGYPERVDVSPKWPTGPEYYNSTIVVNGDGETIANYRKSFLYVIDETWALESRDGFFTDELPGLGNVAMGICMDLNPYKFEAPWHAFEFAFHILAEEANLVIITMAWVTREDGRLFSRMPEEPDMETLTYWVQRLEPLIRVEGQDEVIVIFANRTGMEDNITYAGTSAVVGIKDEEVKVYGLLGRSVKDLLVVDTDNGPFAKLVQRSSVASDDTVSKASGVSRRARPNAAAAPSIPQSTITTASHSPRTRSKQTMPSPTPNIPDKAKRVKPQSPKIQIPEDYYRTFSPQGPSPTEESPGVETPTCPSPTPSSQRPNITGPHLESTKHHVDTPYPRDTHAGQSQPRIFSGQVSINATTPSTASPISGPTVDKYFSLGSQPPLRSPMETRFPNAYPPSSPAVPMSVPSSLVNIHLDASPGPRATPSPQRRASPDNKRAPGPTEDDSARKQGSMSSKPGGQGQDEVPPRPASPKSRNASRSGRPVERRPSELNRLELSEFEERLAALARRPGSAMAPARGEVEGQQRQGRQRSRKSSVTHQTEQGGAGTRHSASDEDGERPGSASYRDVPFMASPSIFADVIDRPQSDILKNREQNMSRAGARPGSTGPGATLLSESRAGSISLTSHGAEPHIEPDETRTLVWSELSKMVGEVLSQPRPRGEIRGRQKEVSRLATSKSTSLTRKATLPEGGSAARGTAGTAQRLMSQDRGSHKPIRTILARDGPNAPPMPYNPDDEIVAEIIFHAHNRPGHANPQRRQSSVETHRSPSQAESASSAPTVQKAMISHQVKNSHSTASGAPGNCSSPEMSEKGVSLQNFFGDVRDGASVNTEVTHQCSPPTPSTRMFEPKTPKAMGLDDLGLRDVLVTPASDPQSDGKFPPLDSLANELVGDEMPRAKSASW